MGDEAACETGLVDLVVLQLHRVGQLVVLELRLPLMARLAEARQQHKEETCGRCRASARPGSQESADIQRNLYLELRRVDYLVVVMAHAESAFFSYNRFKECLGYINEFRKNNCEKPVNN